MVTPNLKSKDYYQILGCPRNADDAALKKAYRKLAVKWHPDKNPENPEAKDYFQKISEAYATLSDPAKRKVYDAYGEDGVRAQEAGGSAGTPQGGMPAGFHPFGSSGASPFGAAGVPGGTTFHFSTSSMGGGGGGGGGVHMSQHDAEAFFSQFFGNDDPFGGFTSSSSSRQQQQQRSSAPFSSSLLGGFGGSSMAGGGGGGGIDPFRMSQSMGNGASLRRAPPRYDAIPSGTVVSLKGLVNRPERNGDRGEVVEYDPQQRRYTVSIEDGEEVLKVKPHNLLQHVAVKIHGVESQPDLNGQNGTIIAWNNQTQRYNIYVSMESNHYRVVSLKPANVILKSGTVAMIMGLNSKPELNGRYGQIKTWHREANRYEVQISPDQIIRVKVENIRV